MRRDATGLGSVLLGSAIAVLSAPAAGGEPVLHRAEVAEPTVCSEVTCDIGDLIAAVACHPRDAIATEAGRRGRLAAADSPIAARSPLAAEPAQRRSRSSRLVIDPQLQGTYDVYAIVRAVDGGRALAAKAAPADPLPMAFELALDDASQREIVGAKGFPDRHFDTEVLAGCGWRMDGRKLVVRSLGKPVYLYGFRFVPCAPRPSRPLPARPCAGWPPTM